MESKLSKEKKQAAGGQRVERLWSYEAEASIWQELLQLGSRGKELKEQVVVV